MNVFKPQLSGHRQRGFALDNTFYFEKSAGQLQPFVRPRKLIAQVMANLMRHYAYDIRLVSHFPNRE